MRPLISYEMEVPAVRNQVTIQSFYGKKTCSARSTQRPHTFSVTDTLRLERGRIIDDADGQEATLPERTPDDRAGDMGVGVFLLELGEEESILIKR